MAHSIRGMGNGGVSKSLLRVVSFFADPCNSPPAKQELPGFRKGRARAGAGPRVYRRLFLDMCICWNLDLVRLVLHMVYSKPKKFHRSAAATDLLHFERLQLKSKRACPGTS